MLTAQLIEDEIVLLDWEDTLWLQQKQYSNIVLECLTYHDCEDEGVNLMEYEMSFLAHQISLHQFLFYSASFSLPTQMEMVCYYHQQIHLVLKETVIS